MQGVTYKWTASTRIKVAAAASIEQASDDPARTFLASKWIGGGGDNDKESVTSTNSAFSPCPTDARPGRIGYIRIKHDGYRLIVFGALPSFYIPKM
jgi:hypothetical protein